MYSCTFATGPVQQYSSGSDMSSAAAAAVSPNQDEVSPHAKRLIRLIVSSPSSTDESFVQSLALLSNIASCSSSKVVWDLIYILHHSLTREDWYPDDVNGFKESDKSVSILVKKKNAALALERIAAFLPIQDQKAFFTASAADHDGDCLWLSIHDFLKSTTDSQGEKSIMDDKRDDVITHVLKHGRLLLSSVGEEYDVSQYNLYQREHLAMMQMETSITTNPSVEELTLLRIKMQREILAARLGLGNLPPTVLNLQQTHAHEFITDNDLLEYNQPNNETCRGAKKRSASKAKDTLGSRRKTPKRKKEPTIEPVHDDENLLESPLRILLQRSLTANMDSIASNYQCLGNHPQNILATELLYQVFHPKWHVRLGALLGLLSLLRAWKRSCRTIQSFGNWPNDILARAVAVLALDRFGDYSGSHFIPSVGGPMDDGKEDYIHEEDLAPVREIAADVLSMLLMWAPMDEVQYPCMKVLSKLAQYEDHWEVRHGAMLAFRFIAVRCQEGSRGIYDSCWKEIPTLAIRGLSDSSDDLKGASAQVLSSILSLLLQRKQENASNLRDLIGYCSVPLWESVRTLSDVASSTYYLLKLLSEIMIENSLLFLESLEGHNNNSTVRLDINLVFCRLAEFLYHSLSSVRVACLNAITNISGPISDLYMTRDIQVRKKLLITYAAVIEKLFEIIMTQGSYGMDDVSRIDTVPGSDTNGTPEYSQSQNSVSSMALNQAWRSIANSCVSFFSAVDDADEKDLHALMSHLLIRLICRLIGMQDNDNVKLSDASTNFESSRVETHSHRLASKSGEYFWNVHSACGALSYLYSFAWCQHVDFCVLGSTITALIQSPWLSSCETGCIFVSVLSQKLFASNNDDMATQFLEILWSTLAPIADNIPLSMKINAFSDKSIAGEIQLISSCGKDFHKIVKDILIIGTLDDLKQSTSVCSKKILDLWLCACGFKTTIDESPENRMSENMDLAEVRTLASIACALVTISPKFSLPLKLTPLVRSLMTSIKNETNKKRRMISCEALFNLIKYLTTVVKSSTAYITKDKVIDSLCCLATEKSPITQEGRDSARIIIKKLISDPSFTNDMEQLKLLWSIIDALHERDTMSRDVQTRARAIDLFCIISTCIPKGTTIFLHVTEVLLPSITTLACSSVQSPESATARVSVANFCKIDPTITIPVVIPVLWYRLNDALSDIPRSAGALLLNNIVDFIGVFIAPFVRILLPMIMSLMMDPLDAIAKASAAAFFSIVRIAPLAASQEPILISGIERGIQAESVIDHLILGKKLPSYELPDKIASALQQCNFNLRPYQIEGISWLAFLRSVNLNGALCDDMGLGKTLQAIVSIAAAHSDVRDHEGKTASLVICPSSLTGYWMTELSRILSRANDTNCIQYVGSPKDRQRIWDNFSTQVDCIFITSYNILRSDINQLEKLRWTYCILDEGHLLKNPKSATAKASRRLRSKHKLILSGTPLQNHIIELWAIFDFLMPNYLGSDIEFSSRFGKDICRGQLPGASTEDIQRGLHKLRQLHQQVLPFILRREKNQVLNELPPKTITLIPCELSPIQSRLYRYLSSNQEVKNTLLNVDRILENPIESGDDESNIHMVHNTDLSALHNLRLICTHPSLLSEKETIVKNSDDLSNIECSGKLLALNDLLRSAQIVPSEVTGADNDESLLYINEDASSGLYDNGSGLDFSDDFNKETGELASVESPRVCRKCLIYSQFRQSLDAVEQFLFKYQMPSLKYLRIDGSIEAHKRTAIVQRFNDDDDIQCLLLTTKVGGLGLNLQAASIVIFLENDWNPHSDLQAMDRAHRLGQSKIVDVYHLVSCNTIEEKILQVQDRKLKMSAAIVNTENSSMYSMGTEALLDLF